MLISSSDLLAGLSVAVYEKLMERKSNKALLKEGAIIAVISALAKAWDRSAFASAMIPVAQRKYIYAAILNVVREVAMDSEKLDLEMVVEDSAEAALAVLAGEWLSSALALTW